MKRAALIGRNTWALEFCQKCRNRVQKLDFRGQKFKIQSKFVQRILNPNFLSFLTSYSLKGSPTIDQIEDCSTSLTLTESPLSGTRPGIRMNGWLISHANIPNPTPDPAEGITMPYFSASFSHTTLFRSPAFFCIP